MLHFCYSRKHIFRIFNKKRKPFRERPALFVINSLYTKPLLEFPLSGTALAAIMDRGVLCLLYGNRIWLCGQQHPYL